jgi:hypothetical protein
LHQAGEALGEDLNLAADRAFLALQLGLKLARSGEALLELARGRGPRRHALPRCETSPRVLLGPCDERLTEALVEAGAALFIGHGGVPVWMVHAANGGGFGGQPWAVAALLANSFAT